MTAPAEQRGSPVVGNAVLRGAGVGLCIVGPLSALRVVLDHNVAHFDRSGWVPLFAVALFVAYGIAGWVAGRSAPDAPLSNGLLAGVGTLVAWLPIRILIWAVREDSRGLFTGHDPVFTVGQLFGAVLFAAVFGFVGGLIAGRSATMERHGGEAAGRPRAEPFSGGAPSEERPDSTGHGAG